MQLADLVGIFDEYRNASVANPPQNVQQDYQRAAEAVPATHLADALGAAFRSGETPPFSQMVSSLFANSSPDQRAGILNHLLGAVGPRVLGSLALGGLGGILGGTNANVSPEQAKQISPEDVQLLAAHAEQQNPSIIDHASQFYSQHPNLVQALGAGSLALIMSHLSRK
jgi:hypothetical protein